MMLLMRLSRLSGEYWVGLTRVRACFLRFPARPLCCTHWDLSGSGRRSPGRGFQLQGISPWPLSHTVCLGKPQLFVPPAMVGMGPAFTHAASELLPPVRWNLGCLCVPLSFLH